MTSWPTQSGSSRRALLLVAIAGAMVARPSPAGAQQWFFDNFNGGAVMNKPTKATVITVTATVTITQLITYHWNNGLGAAPGRIGLRGRGGKMFGPFQAVGEVGQNNVQNAAWDAVVNVTVPPGNYTVVDTDPATWAQNTISGGKGFTRVAAIGPTSACLAPKSKKNVPFGGDCRNGPGCEHPDLTSYGGNGPASSGTNIHLHITLPPVTKFIDWAGTNDMTLATRCTNMGGILSLIDDEPWYFYFSGFWPRWACV